MALQTAQTKAIELVTADQVIVDKFRQSKVANEPSLDDLIYAYLTAGQTQV